MTREEIVEAMARAAYESERDPNDTPMGGFTRWATWDEACQAHGWKASKIAAMKAALTALSNFGLVIEQGWRPLIEAPHAKPGETWGPKILLGREGRAESNAIGQYQAHLCDSGQTLEVAYGGGVFRHEYVPFTHFRPMPAPPLSPSQKEQDDG